MGPVIAEDARAKIMALPGVADAKVHIVESNQSSSIYGLAPDQGSQSVATADARAERATKTTIAIARLRAQQGVLLAEPIAFPVIRPR